MTQASPDQQCQNCRFFRKWTSNLQVGHCYRFPPGAVKDKADLEAADAFPVVSVDGWCGEFQPS